MRKVVLHKGLGWKVETKMLKFTTLEFLEHKYTAMQERNGDQAISGERQCAVWDSSVKHSWSLRGVHQQRYTIWIQGEKVSTCVTSNNHDCTRSAVSLVHMKQGAYIVIRLQR